MKMKGFTLLETMIVVVIIGVIAMFAYPTYQDSINRTHRGDAQGALISLASVMERRFTENNSYCDSADNTGTIEAGPPACGLGGVGVGEDTGPPEFFATTVPANGANVTYDLTIEAVTGSTFTLQATGVGVMADDECGDFTLTNTGIKNITNQDVGVVRDDCW